MPFAAGQRLGSYQLDFLLDPEGGGECYRAKHLGASEDAYVRVLARSWSGEPENSVNFDRHVEAMRQLNHPGVARLFEIGAEAGILYSASEWLDGETLRQKLSKGKLLPNKAAGYAAQIARAIAAAHSAGLVHADLKPENILVTREGRVKIRDFGMANLAYSDSEYPRENTAIQMVADYASPEQVRGEQETVQSDIFSLGVILYEMLSGIRPFLRDSLVATTGAILNEEPTELPPVIPPGLGRIVRHCVSKSPAMRFTSASDVAIAIEAFGSLTVPQERSRKLHRSSHTGAVLATVAGLVMGAGIGGLAARKWLRPVARTSLVFRQLTLSGHDFSPSASADGKTIAFSSDRGGISRIWLMQLDQGREAPLTGGPDVFPRISADGRTVLFIRRDASGDNLYTIPAAGGAARKILDRVDSADWWPRQGILWSRQSQLGAVDAAGKHVREIARAKQPLWQPRVSPDGKLVAAIADQLIFVAKLDAAGRRYTLQPPAGAGEISGLAWSDSGENLVYFQSENQGGGNGGAAHMIRQNAATGGTAIIGLSRQSVRLVDVLGAGRLIFDGASGRQNLQEIALPSGGALAAAGKPVTLGDITDEDPVYAPDGASLFFASVRGGRSTIWGISFVNGAARRVIREVGADDVEPFPSSDGKRIFWSSNRDGHFEIYSASLADPLPRAVTHDGVSASNPSVTASGEWVVYNSANPIRLGVWKTRPTGVDDKRLAAGETRWPEVSTDGRYVLYTVDDGPLARSIKVVSLETGKPAGADIRVTLGRGEPDSAIGRARWMPGGRAIAFIARDEGGRMGVFRQGFPGSREKLGGFDDLRSPRAFAVSPDGRRLALAALERMSAIVEIADVPGVAAR